MEWTHARPTQTGFYWFRDTKRGFPPQLVEVVEVKKMGFAAQKELWFDDELVSQTAKTAQWAGPIPFPSEPRRLTPKPEEQ